MWGSSGRCPAGQPTALNGGHKVLACDKQPRPICSSFGGGGTPEYNAGRCLSEGDLYAVARGDLTLYDPNEGAQSCVIATAHPCGDSGGSRTYFGPHGPNAPGGAAYDVITGYAALPHAWQNNGCVFPGDEVERTGEWDALSIHSVLNAGLWLHTQADEDYHHIKTYAPNLCTRNTTAVAGLRRRTGCWVAANTFDGMLEARRNFRCYYATDRVSVKVLAFSENPLLNPAAVPVLLGGTLSASERFWLEVHVQVQQPTTVPTFAHRLDVHHNNGLIASCTAAGADPDCTCDGDTCVLRAAFDDLSLASTGGIAGWYTVHVYGEAIAPANPDHRALVTALRVDAPPSTPIPVWSRAVKLSTLLAAIVLSVSAGLRRRSAPDHVA